MPTYFCSLRLPTVFLLKRAEGSPKPPEVDVHGDAYCLFRRRLDRRLREFREQGVTAQVAWTLRDNLMLEIDAEWEDVVLDSVRWEMGEARREALEVPF